MTARPTLIPRRMNGRDVLDTGAVCIGLFAEPQRARDPGVHAEAIQRAMTAPLPQREWHEAPRVIDLKPSLRKRVALILRGFK